MFLCRLYTVQSMFRLLFDVEQISYWSTQYSYPQGDELPKRIGRMAQTNGYLSRDDFLELAKWKSPRPAKLQAQNEAQMVREVTEFAYGALGVTKAPYDWSASWLEYTAYCRVLATRAKVDIRTLDKALWAYSDAHGLVAR